MSLSTKLTSFKDECVSKFRQLLVNRSILPRLSREILDPTRSFPLLGPPEIYLSASKVDQKPVSTGDPFMDIMISDFNKTVRPPPPSPLPYPFPPPRPNYIGFTENRSPTYLSSGNHCLDFFFHVVPDTPAEDITRRLELAWEQDPLMALKLVCNLRGVRGTGKLDKEGFYTAALWLHKNHPKTLACNTNSIAEFGYFKDLPEILDLLLKGPDAKKIAKQHRTEMMSMKQNPNFDKKQYYSKRYKGVKVMSNEEKRIAEGKKGVEMYKNDPVYRFLHDQISRVFAEQLMADVENLNSGMLRQLSFAAKWCPSLYSSYDRSTLLCESIARRIFPRELYLEYAGLEDAHYAYRIRDRLRKEVLVPLRKALKLPEVYMSANEWKLLPYTRVPSIAMKVYTDSFVKHDNERFEDYLDNVKKGKVKIAAGALLPHDIIASLRIGAGGEVAILQWQRMVEDLSAEGKLKNCLAICDVSASMSGIPMDVSVALGLLVSELSEEPWKGKLITFSQYPQIHIIKGKDIQSKINSIERMEWGLNTDFQKVFDKILEVAKKGNLSEDQMIKRLFVFSDMEFDEASGKSMYGALANNWETDYEVITRKFHESGYSSVPEIVFWNLRDSKATPVPSHQKGVALVSGFSKNLMKVFLKEGGVMNPEATMELAVSGDEYNKLMVVD